MRPALAIAVVVAAALQASCMIQRISTRRLTGTCDGACAHYVECKPGHQDADRDRCRAECPDVLGDQDTLMQYESLSCRNAVEFVDGTAPRSSAR